MMALIGGVAERARIVGVTVTKAMPDRGSDGMAAMVAAGVLAGEMGIVARGRGLLPLLGYAGAVDLVKGFKYTLFNILLRNVYPTGT